MNRKDTLRALLSDRERPKLPDDNSGHPTRTHVRSGAVGAMGRSLGQIVNAAEEARALVTAGDTVVELDPECIDSSFVTDRLESDEVAHAQLVELIRERGQQVPILVRPHPEKAGHYQVAYGHRRVRAVAELGKRVRAVVRVLSDEELVVAQGQENSVRTDLSYIERGLFAVALEDRGFERAIIMSALNMEKTQLSRLISVARAIPNDVAAAIGPAPRAGRPRWTTLVERLAGKDVKCAMAALLADPTFRDADSDQRFARVLDALSPKRMRKPARTMPWRDEKGRKVAAIERIGQRVAIVIDQKHVPEFGEFLVARLPEIYEAFRRRVDE